MPSALWHGDETPLGRKKEEETMVLPLEERESFCFPKKKKGGREEKEITLEVVAIYFPTFHCYFFLCSGTRPLLPCPSSVAGQ